MKNLFAFNNSNKLINISEVDKLQKEKYYCCNCNNELIARKGKIKAHHFSHKKQLDCNYETYLHKLGKLKFYQEYTNSLNLKKPFLLQYKTERTCNSCSKIDALNLTCKISEKLEYFDLTKRFDKISLEKKHNGFIADILLESSQNDDKIFIEIAVTHKCEKEKIENGIRIIEINLSEDNDLYFLSSKKLQLDEKNVDFYNFKTNREIKPFRKNDFCKKPHKAYVVYNSKKSVFLKDVVISKIIDGINNRDYLYYKIIEPEDEYDYQGDTFISLTREASDLGIDIRNCFACRFSAINNRYDQVYPLWCKKHRAEIPNSNDGVYCENFWRVE
jgi:hypothetical protein